MAAAGRRRVLQAALAGLVLWAGWALAREVRHLQWREREGLWLDAEPCLWRYGTPPVDRLEAFLGALRPQIGGAEVQFSSAFRGQDARCAYLWAAYLAPETNLDQGPPDAPLAPGATWLVFAPRPERRTGPSGGVPGAVRVRELTDGILYRVPP